LNKFINDNSLFEDIRSEKSRINFDEMVNYLCSRLVPPKKEDLTPLIDENLEQLHQYISKTLYSKGNYDLSINILKSRTEINDFDIIDGFSWIYELDRDIILRLESRKYFESVSALEHELIHIIQAIRNNNPKEQYNEILSFFGEILTLELLSEKYENPSIYENAMLNRIVSRMSHRVFASTFEDENVEKESNYIMKWYVSAYPYMLGFIYAIRLLDIYITNKEEVIEKFNDVLQGNMSIDELLSIYNISLEDDRTVDSFKKMCDMYEKIVLERYDKSDLHYVK